MLDTTTEAGTRAAGRLRDIPPANEYVEKYRESIARIGFDPDGFARAYSVALRVTPDRCRVR
jgi:hypothetical protein